MFTKNFKELSKKDVGAAGGKGASLGEMTQAGLPVPPGFVVLASAFDGFLRETEIEADIQAILKKVNHKDTNSVEKASEKIRSIILTQKMPEDIKNSIEMALEKLSSPRHTLSRKVRGKAVGLFAVRSSATAEDSKTASWAGELETYLNIEPKNILKYVQKCWSSLFTPRAIFYAFEKGIYKATSSQSSLQKGRVAKVSVAVVVQKMVQSEVSGIAFTVHPVTEDYDQMVIEAGFGLGEAIVGGLVTPDTYIVDKKNFSVLDINVSEQSMAIVKTSKGNIQKKLGKQGAKQKLTGRQIVELAKVCKNIEKHYKHPQDIEWVLEKGKFYITQSRPITTLKN